MVKPTPKNVNALTLQPVRTPTVNYALNASLIQPLPDRYARLQ